MSIQTCLYLCHCRTLGCIRSVCFAIILQPKLGWKSFIVSIQKMGTNYNQSCKNSIQNTRSNQCNSKRVDVGRVDPMLKVCYWNFVIEEIGQYPWLQAIGWLRQLGTMGTTVWHRFTPCHCVTVFPEKYTAKTVASFNTVILQDKKSKSHVPNGLTTSYDCEPLKHWIRICLS